ncbi:MAG: COX15/CtaA family protein [Acidobacteriota bacterium]|nr:COX15/CtaA family protein [Acidobacteriota bacterium]
MKNVSVKSKSARRFTRFAWFVVAYNILVVVWGAFVRASKSGDGCGTSYPLCNGMIVPHAAEIKTIVEFSHRLSSGVALLCVIALVFWAFRAFPRKHLARKGAVLSLVFILTEAAIGAGLVLLELVAHNDSIARAVWMSAHLVNTFILLAVLVLTAYWAGNGERRIYFRGNETRAVSFAAAIAGMMLVGVSGAIAALGDTLFPAESLAHGIQQDFSETAHVLIRLRIWHPVLSILTGLFMALLATRHFRQKTDDQRTKHFSLAVIVLVLIQLAAGALNVLLLTPIWMQLLHLFLADLLWLSLILLAVSSLSQTAEEIVEVKNAETRLETVEV